MHSPRQRTDVERLRGRRTQRELVRPGDGEVLGLDYPLRSEEGVGAPDGGFVAVYFGPAVWGGLDGGVGERKGREIRHCDERGDLHMFWETQWETNGIRIRRCVTLACYTTSTCFSGEGV